jgi:hypothetical protein
MDYLARARKYIGVVTKYAMGGNTATCMDCSQFVWTVLGRPKFNSNIWWNTDRIIADATGDQVWFRKISDPVPGCIAVYGKAQNNGHTGHVAFVSDPDLHTIIDCSASHSGVHEHEAKYFYDKVAAGTALFCEYTGA